VLAALRFFQSDGRRRGIEELASNGGKLDPLSADEIDTLCEVLNFNTRDATE
jgi:hypothetical protein